MHNFLTFSHFFSFFSKIVKFSCLIPLMLDAFVLFNFKAFIEATNKRHGIQPNAFNFENKRIFMTFKSKSIFELQVKSIDTEVLHTGAGGEIELNVNNCSMKHSKSSLKLNKLSRSFVHETLICFN